MKHPNYPCPCDKCEKQKTCETWRNLVKKCGLYRHWINFWLTHTRKILMQPRRMEEKNVFQWEHPDIYRKWLLEGPCKGCPSENVDCIKPCAKYWDWWDARQEWHKWRFKA